MRRHLAAAVVAVGVLTACGGGGGGDAQPPAPSATQLSGIASKGPLAAALVKAYGVSAGGVRDAAPLAQVETAGDGSYTLNLGTYTGTVQLVVEVIPGRTRARDEVTGAEQTLPDDFRLRAMARVAAGAGGGAQIQNASITPFTELATRIAEGAGGLTPANVDGAARIVFELIGLDPVSTRPLDATVAPPAGATEEQKRYALFNAAVSKLAAGAPASTDPAVIACFGAAGSNAGRRIQCASEQIAGAFEATPAAGSTPASAKADDKLLGLAAALVAVAGDPAVNRTGVPLTGDDAAVRLLADIERDVSLGSVAPITIDVPAQQASDIAKARQFVGRLRSNARALETGPLDSGLADGVNAFGSAIDAGARAVGSDTGDFLRLASIAQSLWDGFRQGRTTNPNSPPVFGFPGGCTVYQGDFPTRFGGDAGAALQPYVATATVAGSASNASWVGCSLNRGPAPTIASPGPRYRRTILFHFAAATAPATIPYLAITRKDFHDGARVMTQNLMAPVSGVVGYTDGGGNITGIKAIGDLPPAVDAAGNLLAARYTINLDGAESRRPSGAWQLVLTGGSVGVVPAGATTASLTVDLSAGSATVIVIPESVADAAQLADARAVIAASIRGPLGELKGTLTVEDFATDSFGNLEPRRLRFVGSAAAAAGSAPVSVFLTGTFDVALTATPTVSFEGGLAIPGRPAATLSLSVTQTAAPSATSDGSYTLTGRYVQDQVSVQITGSRGPGGDAVTLADSGGVSVSVVPGVASPRLLVSGREAAVFYRARNRVVYADGSFETL